MHIMLFEMDEQRECILCHLEWSSQAALDFCIAAAVLLIIEAGGDWVYTLYDCHSTYIHGKNSGCKLPN